MNNKLIYVKKVKKVRYIQNFFKLNALNFKADNLHTKIFLFTLNLGVDETFFYGNLHKLNSSGKLVVKNMKDLSRISVYYYCPSIYYISLL